MKDKQKKKSDFFIISTILIMLIIILLLCIIIGVAFAKYIFNETNGVQLHFYEYRIAEDEIKISPEGYTTGKVTVTITTVKPGLSIKYKLEDNSEWINYTGPFNINENTKISARLVAENFEGPITEKEITNIDKVSPTIINTESMYVTDGLVTRLDGVNNNGGSHSTIITTWKDLSNNGKNGTITDGRWGENYLQFNGTSSWVNLGVINSDYQTIEATFSPNVVPTSSQNIIGNWESSGGGIYIDSNRRIIANYYIEGAYRSIISKVKVVANQKYHVAVTYDGTNLILYVNGVEQGRIAISGIIKSANNSTVMALGTNPNGTTAGGDYFNGKIYTAAVYNKALTAEQVKKNADAGKALAGGPTNAENITYTITFNEKVEGFTTDDIIVTNGTKGSFTEVTAGRVYRLVVTTSANQNNTQTVKLIVNGCTDSSGNGIEETRKAVVIDRVAPTVTLSTNGGTYNIEPGSTTVAISTTLVASDTGSGVAGLGYAWATSNSTEPSSWAEFTSETAITALLSGGNNYIWTNVIDNAGNRATSIKTSSSFNVIYDVVFDNNGGTGAPNTHNKVHGTELILSSTNPTKAGYTFKEWNTKVDGTGTSYAPGASYTQDSAVTLYAIWTEKTYTLTVNPNGGTLEGSTATKTYTMKYSDVQNIVEPTKNGYTFAGWRELSTGMFSDDSNFANGTNSIVQYTNINNNALTLTRESKTTGNTIGNYELKITNNGTAQTSPGLGGFLQRKYCESSKKYIHVFVAKLPKGYYFHNAYNSIGNEGTTRWLTPQEGTGEFETYAYEVHTGTTGEFKNFGHVYMSKSITNIWNPETIIGEAETGDVTMYLAYSNIFDITSDNTGFGMIDGSGILTAEWTVNQYTVEYYQGNNTATAGATKLTSSSHTYGTAKNLTAYSGTAPSGWTFAGWSANNGTTATTVTYTNSQSVNNLTATNKGTIKLYAIFKRNVTFKSAVSGGTSKTVEQRYNPHVTTQVTSVTPPALAAVTNWTAIGYRTDATAGTATMNAVKPAYNSTALTYYGVYSRQITFKSGAPTGTAASTKPTQYLNVNGNKVSAVSAPVPTAITSWTALGYRANTTASTASYAVTTSAANISPAYTTGNTMYAVYSRTLTIKYAGNSNTGGSTANTTKTIYLNSNQAGTSSQAVTLATNGFTKTGYTFSKWTIGSTDYAGGASYTAGLTYNATSFTVTATAKWTANTYKLTVDANGGTIPATTGWTIGSESVTATKNVTYGSTYGTLPTPTKTGYTFAGWNGKNLFNKDATPISTPTYIKGDGTTLTSNEYSLYQVSIKPNTTYTITNSGKSNAPGYVIYNSSGTRVAGADYANTKEITFTTPSTASYIKFSVVTQTTSTRYDKDTFQLEENSKATAYESYYVTSNMIYTTAANNTLHAKWTANAYKLTVDANGGTIPATTGWTIGSESVTATKNVTYGSTYGTLPTPTKTGYTFAGWYNVKECGDITINSSTNNYSYKSICSNVQPGNKYTITIGSATCTSGSATKFTVMIYDNVEKTWKARATADFGSNRTIEITCPETADVSHGLKIYIYAGEHGSTANNAVSYTNVKIGTMETTTEAKYVSSSKVDTAINHTLYAKWTINNYTLTINPNGGTWNGKTSNTTVTQNYNTTYSVTNNPTRAGYVFNGWQLSGSGRFNYYDTSVTPTEKKTINYNSATSTLPYVYNNSKNGTVTNSMVADSTATGGYSLKVVTEGTASPGTGGICTEIWPTTPGRINVLEVKAKIPTGYNLQLAGIGNHYTGIGSAYGSNDIAGSGDWKTYYMVVFTGDNGKFYPDIYLYLSGSNNTSVIWYINSIVMKSYTKEQFKSKYTFGGGNDTLTAKWSSSGSTVTFNTNSGKFNTTYVKNWSNGYRVGSDTSVWRYYDYNTAYATHPGDTNYDWTPDSRVISREGYTFDGWYTAASGGTKIFNSDGTLVKSVSGYSDSSGKWIKYDANVKLYAQWVDKTAPVIVSATASTTSDIASYVDFNATDAGSGIKYYNISTTNTAPTTWIPVVNDVETATETKYENNAAWARVFHHNNHWGNVLFSDANSGAEAKSSNTIDKYSVLGNIANYKNSSNWEFMLQYPDVSGAGYNRWTQTVNPTTSSRDVGYTAIGTPTWTGSSWKGFALSSSYTQTFIDGSPNYDGSWWFSIGAYKAYAGGIPGPNTTVIGTVNLWSRIDNLSNTVSTNLTRRLGDLKSNTTYYVWVKDASGNTASKEVTVSNVDTTAPKATITSTNNVAASQTATLTLSDNVGLDKYYWGTSNPANSNVTYTAIEGSPKTTTIKPTVSANGTYYLAVLDKAGNRTIVSKAFYKTTLTPNSGSVSPTSVITMAGNAFTVPTPSAVTGYTFNGWYKESALTNSVGTSYTPTSNTTLYGKWTINQYTLTINPNGGTWNGKTASTTVTQNYNTTYNLEIPTREGYVFNGWTLSGSGTFNQWDSSYDKYDSSIGTYSTMFYNANSESYTTPYTSENSTASVISDSTATEGYACKVVTNVTASKENRVMNDIWTCDICWPWNYVELPDQNIQVLEVRAKIPKGYNLNMLGMDEANAGLGANYKCDSNAGTGDWKTYYIVTYIGNHIITSGDGEGLYIDGSDSTSVTWYVDYVKYATFLNMNEFKSIYTFGLGNSTLTANWACGGSMVSFNLNNNKASWYDIERMTPENGYYVRDGVVRRVYKYNTDYATYPADDIYNWTPMVRELSYNSSIQTFEGWFTQASGGTKIFDSIGTLVKSVSGYSDSSGKWIKYDASVELYAHWTKHTYTVEYYQGNNTGTAGATKLTSSSHTCGTAKNLTAYSGTAPSGWTFAGWSANNGTTATTVKYTNSQSVNDLTSENGGTIKLYAIFKRNVTFKSAVSGGTSKTVEQRYNPHVTSQVTSVTPPALAAVTNWTATGYRADATAGTATMNAVKPAYNSTALTYYGVYSRQITFISGAPTGTAASTKPTQYLNINGNKVSSVSAPVPTAITSWTALGYRGNTTAGTATYAVTISATNISPAYTTGRTLYAVYSRTLTIKYVGNSNTGGSTANTTKTIYLNSNQAGTSSQAVTLAGNGFTRTGYTFSKWTIGSTDYAGGASYTAGLAYNATSFTVTATAKWTKNNYEELTSSGTHVKYYEALGDAINSATSGNTIKVLDSVTENDWAINDNGKTLTLNTNGKTITFSSYYELQVNSGKLTVNGGGEIKSAEMGIRTRNSAELVATNIKITTTGTQHGIFNEGTCKITLTNVEIQAASAGIYDNGSATISVTNSNITANKGGYNWIDGGSAAIQVKNKATIIGGTLTGNIGLWVVGNSTLIMGKNDSTVSTTSPVINGGYRGICMNDTSKLYFYDGKIVGDDGSGSSIYMSSGSIVTPTGYTVKKSLSGTTETAILSKTSTTSVASEKAPMNLTIVSPNAVNTQSDSDSLNNITKEEISSTNIVASTPQSSQPKIQSNAIDSNNMISKNNLNTDEKNLTQTEQQINENKNSNIVQIAKRSYSTIAEAIASADSGEQIDLLEDITLNEEVIIEKDKNIIINLNDKTLNSTSANTINNKGTLKITGTGNIRNEVENGVVINNNGSLKIENGVITTSKNNGKCINNNSKLEMFGGKIISEGINSSVIYNNTKSETIIKAGTIEVNGDGSKGIYNNSSLVIYNTTDTKTTDNCKDSVKVIVSSDDSCGIYNSKDSTVCDIKCTDILIKADVIENYESIKNTDEFKAKLEEMKPSYGIYNNSNISVNIEGLTMKVERLKGVGIQNNAEGIINIGKKDEILNESNPIIYATSDNTTAIVNINKQKGKIKFYNGSFITTKSIKNEITDVLENYQVYEINDNVIIKSVLSRKEE